MYFIISFIFACLILISVRLGVVTCIKGGEYEEKAWQQNSTDLLLSSSRGNIYDRNLLNFTNGGKKKIAVVVKSENQDEDFEICKLLDRKDAYSNFNKLYKNNIVYINIPWNYNTALIKRYNNVKIFEDTKRYSDDNSGSVVIGYLADNKGVAGIEYAANDYLSNSNKTFIKKDAAGTLLPGISFKKESNQFSLKTTLDKRFIDICQESLRDVSGSVVLIEIPTFNLVAMASSPSFNRNKIEDYLNDESKPFLNRATENYDMGSIFKIIVTAAALENNVINFEDTFACSGDKKIENVHFLCNNHEKSQSLSVLDAFVMSCNSVFIDIGMKTGYNNIIDMAKKFGISEQLIFPINFPQKQGVLPDKNNYYLADAANISIGQGNLMGTAVHGAVISAIIASGGMKRSVNCFDSLIDNDFNVVKQLKYGKEERVISENTAILIAEMMKKTVEYGTGKQAKSEIVSCAGKTGSAETGISINGERQVHGWFTGYFPADNPKYALCVFVENGRSGAKSAAPIFRIIAEKIYNLEG